jgi:hypothetical protein
MLRRVCIEKIATTQEGTYEQQRYKSRIEEAIMQGHVLLFLSNLACICKRNNIKSFLSDTVVGNVASMDPASPQ